MAKALFLCGAALLAASAVPAGAATIADAAGDFLSTYTGPRLDDLDVLQFSAFYDRASATFTLSATMAGVITPGTMGLYVIGVNNGTATNAPFATNGQPGVIFNQTFQVQKAGTAAIGTTSLATTITGATFTVLVPLSALTQSGFDPASYSFNLWPRSGTGGGNGQLADFAPDNAMLSAVPEPGTWALMLSGVGLIGGMMRRRQTEVALG